VGTLREVARVDPVGQAESEAEGTRWLCDYCQRRRQERFSSLAAH
jgi:hypothetical protein